MYLAVIDKYFITIIVIVSIDYNAFKYIIYVYPYFILKYILK